MENSLLKVESVSKTFGGVAALSDVSLTLEEGSISSLIGPNGAGKTTLFNIITRFIPPDSGRIIFREERIDSLLPDLIAGRGIQRTFQLLQVFKELSVLDNVALGMHSQSYAGLLPSIFRFPSMRREEAAIIERSKVVVQRIGLWDMMDVRAGDLPFGQQKLVELGRALVSEPKLLLLDEPTNGLNPLETQKVVNLLYQMREEGISVFVVAHDMQAVMQISNRIFVLNLGHKIAEGRPEEIVKNQEVVEAYLGKDFRIA